MKGLLKNDFYCLVEEESIILIMEVFVVVTSIVLRLSTPGAIFASILLISLTYRCMSIDWELFIDATPINRRTLVLEKYILCALLIAIAALIAFIISYFNVGNMTIASAMPELLKTMFAIFVYGLYDVGFTLLISFVFGKSKIMAVNTILKMVLVLVAALFSIDDISAEFFDGRSIVKSTSFADIPPIYWGIAIVCAGIIYISSYVISAWIYEKREIL